MFVMGAVILLAATLLLTKHVKHSKMFAFFYAISLASASAALASPFMIGGWEGMGVMMIISFIGFAALIGMFIVLSASQRRNM
ncbi:YesK family protein [Bacillus badius]|uniref:Uncharacterized protein n=1 Tax=Bacillus badius TaxID=1455 RepID=A0ABR5AWD8_BACBA|nr:YesK family protein [Bacillus badius]KIL74583.1 hypothetical protein SD78_1652 [Bacillus badius]KIL79048.1 hypothetical protein SD77_3849 [Bacillus badius]KZR58774.1 hypothetical protein A3781_14615 [Bacillus badius]MED4715519.1 YesK family protein [Bacillus badius]